MELLDPFVVQGGIQSHAILRNKFFKRQGSRRLASRVKEREKDRFHSYEIRSLSHTFYDKEVRAYSC